MIYHRVLTLFRKKRFEIPKFDKPEPFRTFSGREGGRVGGIPFTILSILTVFTVVFDFYSKYALHKKKNCWAKMFLCFAVPAPNYPLAAKTIISQMLQTGVCASTQLDPKSVALP